MGCEQRSEARGRDARRRLCGHPGRFKHWTAGSGSGVREEEMTEEILRG